MGDFYHWIYRQPQGIKELISENILFLKLGSRVCSFCCKTLIGVLLLLKCLFVAKLLLVL